MGTDIIAYLITSIRNAGMDNKVKKIKIKDNILTKHIVKLLLREGFIENVRKHYENKNKFIILTMNHERVKTINLKLISRPSIRIYLSYKKIPPILGGIGVAIISTSKGLMTGKEAIIKRIGGEILFYIW
uniref:Small ribosomal subunit protein uS8c n=1 Tax=Epipogium roseum TaxID=556037 RepID=A0A0B4N4Z6_9ASPA|nr:ribosomal protein S8 [Epipogium roseum]AII40860.1 ribosomal protein S8 [Epipogium roseum]